LAFANSFQLWLMGSVFLDHQLKTQQDKQWENSLSKLDKVSKVSRGLD
jgi:histone deacetylase complex regulatory component SIN3